jgi:uncharacterized membrane protein YcaP (DUF421 family)
MHSVDWHQVLFPTTPLVEILFRGSVMYLALFFMLRFIIRREAGALGITDVLLLVLLADAAQNGMAGEYRSVSDGLLLVATLLGWSYALDWLSYRSLFFRKLIRPPRVLLVQNGRMLRQALEAEKITEDELMAEIRTHGVDDVARVSRAYIESDGMISVITRDEKATNPPRRDVF